MVSAAAASGLTASIGRAGAGTYGQHLIAASLFYAFIVGVGVLTCRSSASTLRLMSELDRSRTAHARLAVAEERLRFARDLHDVLGRNLSLIAVQSELAAELARRGDQDAAGQMLQVRQVAHESLREMRAVVRRDTAPRTWAPSGRRAGCPAFCGDELPRHRRRGGPSC